MTAEIRHPERSRRLDKKNHPWEVAKITNRIVYEKLPQGVFEKLREFLKN
jgi:hypothetical protein